MVGHFEKGRSSFRVQHAEIGQAAQAGAQVFLDILFKIVDGRALAQGVGHDRPFQVLAFTAAFRQVVGHGIEDGEPG